MGFDLVMQVNCFFGNGGGRLSNTSTICPKVGDNFGKLKLIPHRKQKLGEACFSKLRRFRMSWRQIRLLVV